jgi:hypothetical protein
LRDKSRTPLALKHGLRQRANLRHRGAPTKTRLVAISTDCTATSELGLALSTGLCEALRSAIKSNESRVSAG